MKRTILVVDDSESIRELVASTLENAGYQVHRGINGSDGVEKLKTIQSKVSLIITDLFMPVMDGIDLIKEVRKIDDYKYLPIIMLTTESHIEKKKEAKAAGVTGWLVKPFEEEMLLRVIHKIIR